MSIGIGVFSTFMSPISTPEMISGFARQAEAIGLDSIWLGEHVVLFDEMEFPYPGSKDGKIPVPENGGMLDAVASIGFMAAETKTIRFGTGITLVPQRNPVYTAKEFATLDWLTQGRIDFGVGVGWCKEEVIACGYTFEDRGSRCDEFLEVIRRMWTEPVASFSGEHFDLPPCRMDPKPIQKPHIPFIIGGHSKAGLRRAARFGNGWYGFQLNVDQTAELIRDIESELVLVGRNLEDFEIVITPPYNFDEEMIRGYEELGVSRLIAHLGSQQPERINQRLALLANFVQMAS